MGQPQRKQTRLVHFDYSQAGWYFVTVCTHQHRHSFGRIQQDAMSLNENGLTVEESWLDIPNHHMDVCLDQFMVMPNHIHGIVVIQWKTGDAGVAPTSNRDQRTTAKSGPPAGSLGVIVGSFKAAVSKKLMWTSRNDEPLWQRGFYDHVIRSEKSLHRIREYIQNNPLSWHLDRLNQNRTGDDEFEQWLIAQSGAGS